MGSVPECYKLLCILDLRMQTATLGASFQLPGQATKHTFYASPDTIQDTYAL